MMNSLFFFKPPTYSSEKSIYNHSVNLPSHLNNPISTTYPFSSCQLDPTAFLQWICLVPRLQPKIRELKFNLQPSEIPLFQVLFTHYFWTLDINATHSTWDELIELMYLRFLAKWSYAGTYRLFCTFVGTYQYYSLFVTQLIVIQQILEDRILFNFVNLIFKNRILLHFKLRAIVNQKDISHLVA